MWEYIVIFVFVVSLQLACTMFGGWLLNLTMGLIGLVVSSQYYAVVNDGLPLGYLMPLIISVFTILLFVSALMRRSEI